MLTYEQLRHFADHGWVLEPRVLNDEQTERYKRGLDKLAQQTKAHHKDTEDITNVDVMVNH